jgi:signal transduction histidine kinase
MAMYEFLDKNREVIVERTMASLDGRAKTAPFETEVKSTIATFFGQLVQTLRHMGDEEIEPAPSLNAAPITPIGEAAGRHGRNLLQLGLDINQIVHIYGAICESTMRLAEHEGQVVAAPEFAMLNRCLDDAIARAVEEFENARAEHAAMSEAEHLGFLVHELRNSLASALIALQVLKKGAVGIGGKTSAVLERSLLRMRDLIDRTLTEVRLRSNAEPQPERLRLSELLTEIAATAAPEAEQRELGFSIDASPGLELDADRQMVISVVANVVQNAIKYTRENGQITVRGFAEHGSVIIEVEDECGGLPDGDVERLFEPFVRSPTSEKGLGLGLAISHRAVQKMGGEIRVRDLPGKGCVFSVSLPQSAHDERAPTLH